MMCFSFLFKRHSSGSNQNISGVQDNLGIHRYPYKELRNATDDFSPNNKIGEGGFGSVYKGKLKNGRLVAVKVLSAESKQGTQEFLTEINVISSIEHENLVKLHGCCVERNNRILVYGYLENNSLAQTLLGDARDDLVFNWTTRCNICVGVARGLAYLHEEVKPRIVHRDIKASNILLDGTLTPKISDFGLAKLFPNNETHISTRVAGTIGYLAPEYAIRGHLTRKADIYSFGVLMLEIISGRCNTDRRLPLEDHYLLERTYQLYEADELLQLVDPSLYGDYNSKEVSRFIRVALLCTQDSAKLRPSMSTVVSMLAEGASIDDLTISRPGLISDFLNLKVRTPRTGSGSGPGHSSIGDTTTYGSLDFTTTIQS
ncbi:putative serine/threonine-protein kinase [Amborella trichopoda]|nr:putative serine/threonine-protein kinase [Amborella trichopoda]XP_020518717.1 putative serine/threonine-protein kinase [Amborella trichopoda]XP_020518718.1 putative serine/threonine-protein kinase [Amborella trichopoda]|eukprot:XP_006836383.2 putative serine/threonine-protein kinase [Amborella trichopoda]